MNDVTQLLQAWRGGDRAAFDALIPLVYDDLHRLAQSCLRRERPGNAFQATALVNEAYLKLANQCRAEWQNRAQFFAVAALVIRRILVDEARKQDAAKNGGGVPHVTLSDSIAVRNEPVDVLALDEALERLATLDARQAQIIELRYFAGLGVAETGETLDISPATVKREWSSARAWLLRELAKKSQ